MCAFGASHLEVVIVILTRKGHGGGLVHLLLVLLEKSLVDLGGGGSKSGGGNKFQSSVSNELACEPEEGLLEVVVGLGTNIVVLKVLFPVESDSLGLHLALLDIDLVTAEDNRDVLAHTGKVTVPVGNVLVGNTGGYIEHDDTALSVDVVAITETTELLLTGGIPDVELDLAEVLLRSGLESE
jgi:hypothetical protein